MIGIKMVRIRKFTLVAGLMVIFCLFYPKEVLAQSVVINGFYPKDPEWVEFYNSGLSSVDLSGFWFDDDSDFLSDMGSSAKKQLSGVLPAGSACYLDLSRYLNDSGGVPTLFNSNGSIVDSYTYTSSLDGKSYSRNPDGGEWLVELKNLTESSISCASLTPTPTSTPTPPPLQSPASSISTVKISQPKDQNGTELLGSLKIYIDDAYTDNYAPETYTFGDGRTCGSNNVPCGFGTHTFKVEKAGYIPWTKTAEIASGNNYEFDPVLFLASPTGTPTIKPIPTATSSATPKSTLASFSISTESGLLAEDVFSNKSVLGVESSSKTPLPSEENIPLGPKFKAAILFLITAGISFLASAVYAYVRSKKRKKSNEQKFEEIEEST